ncbi:MAG: cytochrome c [Acidobacteria bacterium]|nr:cytochrome c [Acidobacteriota bacterium]
MRFATILAAAGLALAQSPEYHGVATAKQIMAGIQKPAMDSLAAMNKAGGPKDEKEWALAEQQAAVLAETAQLLLMGSRPKDQDVWIKSSQKLNATAGDSVKAAQAKDLTAWQASLNGMGGACRSCHNVHRKKKDGTQ